MFFISERRNEKIDNVKIDIDNKTVLPQTGGMFGEPFVVIPKKMINDESIDNKMFLLLAYIRINATYSGKVNTTINHIILSCGYIPNAHKGKINTKFIELLKCLVADEYIFVNCDLDTIKAIQMFEVNINRNKNIFEYEGKFVVVTEPEFNCVTQSSTGLAKDTIFKVYLIIKSYINEISGVGYPSLKSIKQKTNVKSETTIDNAIKDLVDIGILFEYIVGSYCVEGQEKIRNSLNLYAVKDGVLDNMDCEGFMINVYHGWNIDIDNFKPLAKPNTKKKDIDISRVGFPPATTPTPAQIEQAEVRAMISVDAELELFEEDITSIVDDNDVEFIRKNGWDKETVYADDVETAEPIEFDYQKEFGCTKDEMEKETTSNFWDRAFDDDENDEDELY